MAENNGKPCEPPKNPEEIVCQKSPCPGDFDKPQFPDKSYYGNLPNDQLDLIDGDKKKAEEEADGKLKDSYATEFEKLQSAKAEYEAANRNGNTSKEKIARDCVKNKNDLLRNYKKKLVALLPKGCVSGGKDTSIEDKIPKDKWAICVAEFYEDLAKESVNYQNSLKAIEDKLADAKCKWKKAQISYEAAVCIANKIKDQEHAAAETARRKEISKQLESLCK